MADLYAGEQGITALAFGNSHQPITKSYKLVTWDTYIAGEKARTNCILPKLLEVFKKLQTLKTFPSIGKLVFLP